MKRLILVASIALITATSYAKRQPHSGHHQKQGENSEWVKEHAERKEQYEQWFQDLLKEFPEFQSWLEEHPFPFHPRHGHHPFITIDEQDTSSTDTGEEEVAIPIEE